MQSTVTHNSVQIIIISDKINKMQYFHLLNVIFSIFLSLGHHMHVVRIMNINI